jgi:putative tryptophan/tyrosine transport system substrate-binding protein
MRKRFLGFALSLVSALLFAICPFAEAQQQEKVHTIGWLNVRPADPGAGLDQLRRELRKLGYIEGKNIVVESRWGDNRLDQLPNLAQDLVRLKVDVLVAQGTNEALAAKNATKTIPIVSLNLGDPVALGLVDSLARPGGNITGFTTIGPVLAGKRLELLKETVPYLSRVAVLWDPKSPSSVQQWKESQLPARELGLQLHSMETSSADKYESAFKEAVKKRSDAVVVIGSELAGSNLKRIIDLVTKSRLPTLYPRGSYVAGGGLMSYGVDLSERYRRGAVFVDKVLKGVKPADLPVEQPMKFEFIINLKAAKQIGLTIPPNVLARADRVFK